MEGHAQYSVFEYLYRDAANWKTWCSVLLGGTISDSDRAGIETKLDSGQFFIPEQIGLKSLVTSSGTCLSNSSADDHVWHEFVEFRTATLDEVSSLSLWGTSTELLRLIAVVGKWELERSPKYRRQYLDFAGSYVQKQQC